MVDCVTSKCVTSISYCNHWFQQSLVVSVSVQTQDVTPQAAAAITLKVLAENGSQVKIQSLRTKYYDNKLIVFT